MLLFLAIMGIASGSYGIYLANHDTEGSPIFFIVVIVLGVLFIIYKLIKLLFSFKKSREERQIRKHQLNKIKEDKHE